MLTSCSPKETKTVTVVPTDGKFIHVRNDKMNTIISLVSEMRPLREPSKGNNTKRQDVVQGQQIKDIV